jgi:hypothetical protein
LCTFKDFFDFFPDIGLVTTPFRAAAFLLGHTGEICPISPHLRHSAVFQKQLSDWWFRLPQWTQDSFTPNASSTLGAFTCAEALWISSKLRDAVSSDSANSLAFSNVKSFNSKRLL